MSGGYRRRLRPGGRPLLALAGPGDSAAPEDRVMAANLGLWGARLASVAVVAASAGLAGY